MPLTVLIGVCVTPQKLILHIGFISFLLINAAIYSPVIYHGLTTRRRTVGTWVGEVRACLCPRSRSLGGETDGAQYVTPWEGLR